nr:MAG TPA: hypothetical protein [Caudoviricetes sp.]
MTRITLVARMGSQGGYLLCILLFLLTISYH